MPRSTRTKVAVPIEMPSSSPPPSQESATPPSKSELTDTLSMCDNQDTMASSSLNDSLNLVLSSDESFSIILSPPPGFRDNDSSMEPVPNVDPLLLSQTELVPPPEFGDSSFEYMDTSLLDISIEMDPDDPMLESLQELVLPPDETLVSSPAARMHELFTSPILHMHELVSPPVAQMQDLAPTPAAQMQEFAPSPASQMQDLAPSPASQMQDLAPSVCFAFVRQSIGRVSQVEVSLTGSLQFW